MVRPNASLSLDTTTPIGERPAGTSEPGPHEIFASDPTYVAAGSAAGAGLGAVAASTNAGVSGVG